MKKRSLIISSLLLASYANAQDLAAGIADATAEMTAVFAPLKTFLYIMAAIVGIFGAVRVFNKFQNGDQDTNKAMGQWGFAFIFLIAAGIIISAVFGV